jgi:hypothetical protein
VHFVFVEGGQNGVWVSTFSFSQTLPQQQQNCSNFTLSLNTFTLTTHFNSSSMSDETKQKEQQEKQAPFPSNFTYKMTFSLKVTKI